MTPFPTNLILFDTTGFTYYRVMASLSWAKRAGVEPSLENEQFLSSLKGQWFGCVKKFFALYAEHYQKQIDLSDCWSIRDCPREEIWRREFFPDYKGNRDDTPTSPDTVSKRIDPGSFMCYLYRETEKYFGKRLRVPKAEADDTIATLVRLSFYANIPCVTIVTLDSDFQQLCQDPRVRLYSPKPNWQQTSVMPNVALTNLQSKISKGDPTDNIPSVAQISTQLGLVPGQDQFAYNFNARLIDFDYLPRILIDQVVEKLFTDDASTGLSELPEAVIPINWRPRSIQLGLCCLNMGLRDQKIFCSRKPVLRTIQTKGYGELYQRCQDNAMDLIRMIEWNHANGIRVFRISSELFPHYANPQVNRYSLDQFQPILTEAGRRARKYGQRLTFHPSHFNVVGAPDPEKFQKTLMDLDYHAEVLDRLGCDDDSVMVVHGGGQYKDKATTIQRWITQFKLLPVRVQRRLVLENCEKNFNVADCLYISQHTGVPVVFDTHHYNCYRQIHPEVPLESPEYYLPQILESWTRRGIKPKFHVSEQGQGQIGNHSDYVLELPEYLLTIPEKYGIKIDIMIEAKHKERAIYHLYNKYRSICPYTKSEFETQYQRVMALATTEPLFHGIDNDPLARPHTTSIPQINFTLPLDQTILEEVSKTPNAKTTSHLNQMISEEKTVISLQQTISEANGNQDTNHITNHMTDLISETVQPNISVPGPFLQSVISN